MQTVGDRREANHLTLGGCGEPGEPRDDRRQLEVAAQAAVDVLVGAEFLDDLHLDRCACGGGYPGLGPDTECHPGVGDLVRDAPRDRNQQSAEVCVALDDVDGDLDAATLGGNLEILGPDPEGDVLAGVGEGGPLDRNRVTADVDAASRAGVNSTPTLFINGRLVEGALERAYYDYAVIIERHTPQGGSPDGTS